MSMLTSKVYAQRVKLAAAPAAGLEIVRPAAAARSGQSVVELLKALPVLFKLRVVVLLLFAAVGGAFLAAGGWPGTGAMALLLITGGLAASGASAINQYLEQSSDALMTRTRKRPLVNGAITRPGWVPYAGSVMVIGPVLAVWPFNPALAFFLLLGAVIYVGIYTIWLKPRTLLNIVIGGAAGSAAVLSGSAAAGAWNNPAAVVLALLVFLWTPTHFWSLAIVYRNDYARSHIPMLPARASMRQSAWWVLVHTLATAVAALVLAAHPLLGWVYLLPVGIATVDLLARNLRLVARPTARQAWSLFKASNLYLAVVLLLACIDMVL